MVIDQPAQVRTMALLSDIEMGAVALGVAILIGRDSTPRSAGA